MSQCKWCGASIKIGNAPSSRPEWKRYRCNGCGAFGYLNDPGPDELSRLYNTAWLDPENSGTYAAGSTDIQIAHSILRAVNFSPLRCKCLDYGGGKGHFAKALLETGCERITVYEPFGQSPGLNSVNWIKNMNDVAKELFDWIFVIEVMEHFLNPQEELEIIRQHLSQGGKVVITTPNAKGWRARVEGFHWREVQNPAHINLFTQDALESCLTKAGFSNAKRIFRPVKYKAKGINAFFLSMTQIVGIDGGLRIIAINGSK